MSGRKKPGGEKSRDTTVQRNTKSSAEREGSLDTADAGSSQTSNKKSLDEDRDGAKARTENAPVGNEARRATGDTGYAEGSSTDRRAYQHKTEVGKETRRTTDDYGYAEGSSIDRRAYQHKTEVGKETRRTTDDYGYAKGSSTDRRAYQHKTEVGKEARRTTDGTGYFEGSCTDGRAYHYRTEERKEPRTTDDAEYVEWRNKDEGAYQYKKRTKVPLITKEFVLYCEETVVDEWVVIKLLDKEINMRKSPSSNNIYKRKVSISSDFPNGIEYCYEIRQYGRVFGTKSVKCKTTFQFDSRHIYRDIWNKSAVDGICAHIDDILKGSYDMTEANLQITALPFNLFEHSSHKQLLLKLFSNLKLSESHPQHKRHITVAMYLFLTVVGEDELKRLLTEDIMKTLLDSFLCLRFQDLHTSLQKSLPGLCSKLCTLCYDRGTCDVAELFFSFPLLGEQLLYQKLLSKRKIVSGTVSEQNIKFIVGLFMQLYKSSSFGTEDSIKLIEKIIKDLPFELTIAAYASLLKMKTDSESHGTFKQVIQKETVKRTQHELEVPGRDKIGQFLTLWEKVHALGDFCEPFKDIFENFLMNLMKSFFPNVDRVVQIAKEESSLFASLESKKKLLKAIVYSPCEKTAELFMKLAGLHGYVNVYQTLDPLCFEQWYYNCRDTNRSIEKRKMKVVCERLGWVLSLENVLERQEIVDIVRQLFREELKKRSLEQVLKIAKEFESSTKEMTLFNVFLEHVSEDIRNTTCDLAKLLDPFLVGGVLQLNTKFIADILFSVIGKYGNTDETSSIIEQFFKASSKRRLWAVVFRSEGPYRNIIAGHPFYKSTSECIRIVAEKLSNLEIDFKLMKRITAKQDEVTDMLSSFSTKKEVQKLIDCNQKRLEDEENRIRTVTSVIHSVKEQNIKLPDSFEQFTNEIDKRVADFYMGKIEGNKCHLLWETMEVLPNYCLELETVVKSVVYWNLFFDDLARNVTENRNNAEDASIRGKQLASEPEEGIDLELNQADEESEVCDHKQDTEEHQPDDITWNTSIFYIEKMRSVGLKQYKQCMERFLNENDLSMYEVLHIFNCKSVVNPAGKSKPDLEVEKKVAMNIIGVPCENSTWDVLKQIYSIWEIKLKVEGMRSFLQAVQIDFSIDTEFALALESFEQLLGDNVNECSFLQVKSALGMINSVINSLSEPTFEIMTSVGQCSSLVEFLKETVEEDIRNLIDAVEDISEQQVRESTVSGLIEVKQMLLPVLKPRPGENCQQILNSLDGQVKKISKSTCIPAKIYDCMDNLHNLKSLYNNVANRGEQTRQIVKCILEHGYFKFQLDENSGTVFLESKYKQNDSLVKKKKEELIDLRSRSLLLMNTETKNSGSSHLSRKQVETFVEYVDQCIDLAGLFTLLHTSGHFKYISIDKELETSALKAESESLSKEFFDWEKDLHDERSRHYLMTYIDGFGLHSMYLYLNMHEHVSVEDRKIFEKTVQTNLKFIHPEMRAEQLREMYIAEKVKCKMWTSADWLSCLGKALHFSYPVSSTLPDKTIPQHNKKSDSVKMTDVVQEGKLFLAQLDENSLYTVKTVIALYANTVNRMPESHQVLFCTRETTLDDIDLLIERCLGAKNFYGSMTLYCIAYVELLSSELYSEFLDILRSIQEENNNFLLAIVCRGTNSHQIIDELSQFKTTVAPATDSLVKSIFKAQHENVLTLTSDLAGLGKTSRVIKEAHAKKKHVATLHVSGNSRKAYLIERLNTLMVQPFHVLHIDIATVDDPKELDTFIFELLILGYVSVGRMSVALGTKHVYLEIANTINETLRNSLQTTMLFSRENIRWQKFNDFVVSKEIHSAIQIVCKYFSYLEKGCLDNKDVNLEGSKPLSSKTCRRLLKKYLGMKDDTTFPVVNASLEVLADQLKKMTYSPFFRVSRLQEMTGNKAKQAVKSSLIEAMITSTNEFASRSVSSCRAVQSSTTQSDGEHTGTDFTETYDTATRVTQRIQGMIRWEDSNHLMFVFHCQNIQTLSPLYRDKLKVPDNIKELFCSQMNKELQDFKAMSQTQLQDLLQKIARNNPIPLPDSKLKKIAAGYALTPDNLLKMVLIMLRIKANVPVIVMGETGCGKTSLVRYLASVCEVPFDTLNIHAGVTEKVIIDKIQINCYQASRNLESERWLFLDEINTSESIGVMSEVICHHKCLGKSLPPNLVVLGACNPYKLRSKKDIAMAGLTVKSQNDELSRLVYRVLPLPEMMVDYVWDFGSLNETDENLYIKRMVDGLFTDEKLYCLFSDMLSVSQAFVRQKEESACVVSLRDVNRCRLLTEWFMRVLCNKSPSKPYTFNCDTNIRAMILALAHCYHSRFPSKDLRADYRKVLRAKLKEFDIEGFGTNRDRISEIINEEQRDFIYRMELPDGTACNTALMENVFVIIVCIYNRLPVFVVGKPGCSKSLAMQIIRSNLRGKDSKDPFFRSLPQLYCVSFQGSESSTSDGIQKVFAKAENYQTSNSAEDVLSVVILDEIGLAEVSRFNPLKVLHNLLEPNGEMRPHVAVVGLSNWSLDASKMNRAIHLSRTDMDEEELYDTAVAISESFATDIEKKPTSEKDTFLSVIENHDETESETVIFDIQNELKGISKAYHEYSQKLRFKNFHGLRDYYALVKYVAKELMLNKRCKSLVRQSHDDTISDVSAVVRSGLERNFGGLPSESKTLYETFGIYFSFDTCARRDVLDLIAENVDDQIARHLMLITSGDSSLGILEQQLNRIGRNTKEVIFGSQFEDDLTDDYNYRILSRIILCMEEGMILILKDLESIYGSLYDMLNQNYTIIGNKKNCRIALGAYSNPICQVANTFRCIVLMDESKVQSCDPPFLNRFEKQYLSFSDVLNADQNLLVKHLQSWVTGLREIKDRSFDYTDVFPIYSKDLLPSLVLKMERQRENEDITEEWFPYLSEICKRKLIWILKPEAVIRLNRAVSSGIAAEADQIKQSYFDLPLHRGLDELISFELSEQESRMSEQGGILTIVFTNSNMHISLQKCISYNYVQTEKVGTFKSEKQISAKIQQFWSSVTKVNILLVQCNAVDDEKHILLTKSIIERHRTAYQSTSGKKKHVYLIIHTPGNKGISKVVSQINFMSEWNLVMLDSLEPPNTDLPQLCSMDILEAIQTKRPLKECLMNQIFWSFTRIKYSPLGRDVNSIKNILTKIKTSPDFLDFLDAEIWRIVSEMESRERDWQTKVACDMQALRNSSSFVNALEQHILKVIKIPLTKLIFCMEKAGVLDSYFINDSVSSERKNVWLNLFHDEKIFSIANIPDETGPECYSCETPDCSLKMPFSRIIFSRLESQKEEFIEEISVLKSHFEIDDSEMLQQKIYNDLLVKHEKRILLTVPEWNQFCYATCEEDYIHDFSSLLSVHICSSMSKEKRAYNMEWIILQKTDLSDKTMASISIRLHAIVWMNMSLFRSEMLLLAQCEKVGLDEQLLENMMRFNRQQSEQFPHSQVKNKTDMKEYDDKTDIDDDGNENKLLKDECDIDTDMNTEDNKTVSEQVAQIHASSEAYDMKAEDYLVQDICRGMIPTETIIKLYGGIDSWQRTVNAILALASKVSVESKILHELKVCNEVAGTLIIPMQLNINIFFQLGNLLSDNVELDSEEVFNTIAAIVSKGLESKSCQSDCYRVFSSYLVRCISINTQTEVLDFFFMYLIKNPIPAKMTGHFKAPMYYAIDIDVGEIEGNKLQYFLLEDEGNFEKTMQEENKNPNTSDLVRDESEGSSTCTEEEHNGFVYAFDRFFKDMAEKKRLDEPIVLLIVDLLADMFESSLRSAVFSNNSPDRFRSVYDCHKMIIDRKYGIGFISAVAYMRSFISLLDKKQMWDGVSSREYWETVNVLLRDYKLNDFSFTLLMYFLKSITTGLTALQLKNKVERKKENYEFLQKIVWSDVFPHFCFDGSPFCLLTDEIEHSKLRLCNGTEDVEKIEATLHEFALSKNSQEKSLQNVLSFVFNETQLTRSLPVSRDRTILLLTQFTKEIEEKKCEWHRLLQYLSGDEDFKCNGFDMEMESKYLNLNTQNFLLQLFILLLSRNQYAKGETSIFIRCLTRPLSVKNSFLPGFFDSVTDSGETIDANVGLATCNCGSRIAMHFDAIIDTDCVFCSDALNFEKVSLSDTRKSAQFHRTVWRFDDIPQGHVTVRGLHPITFQLSQMILKGCILGSLAFGYSSIENIREVVGDEFKESDFLEDISKHWKKLSDLLNLDDFTMSNFLRVIIIETSEHLCKHHIYPLTEKERSKWEEKFEARLKELLLRDRFETVRRKLCQHNKLHAFKDTSFENLLTETNSITHMSGTERQSMLPLLFRFTNTPTKDYFISECMWRKSQFPFLDLILQFGDKLNMPRHVYSIIQWHVATVASVSYILKKHECLEMTVQQLFVLNPKKKDILNTRFKAFKDAWIELRSFFAKTNLGPEMTYVHTGTKLKECLLYNTDSILFKVLKQLVQIQNEFLDRTLMIGFRSEALHFLSVKENVFVFPCVQITETRREDLVQFQFENDKWEKILKEESLGHLDYGCGRETIYDFRSIEERFAMKVLTGKSFIDFRHSVPNIVFADELYINYADLLLEIKTHIKQKPLTDEIKESVQTNKDIRQTVVKDLLTHLGILLTLLKKTGGDADMALIDYASMWSNEVNHEFPKDLLPNPASSVKLCHIIGLNELLEEISSETVLDALQIEYTDKLDDVASKHVIELLRDLQMAKILLRALKRFVYRGVFTQTADADRPICDYLIDNSFWPEVCHKEKNVIQFDNSEESVQNLLPEYLMVRHVQSFIKDLEKGIEKREKEAICMSDIARDFKQQSRERRNPHNKALAKRAKARRIRD